MHGVASLVGAIRSQPRRTRTGIPDVGASLGRGSATSVRLDIDHAPDVRESTYGGWLLQPTLGSRLNYIVSISAQPANQTCTVGNATGSISNPNITDVTVICETAQAVLSVTTYAGHSYARYGRKFDHPVTLTNTGNATATAVAMPARRSTLTTSTHTGAASAPATDRAAPPTVLARVPTRLRRRLDAP